MRVVRQRRWRLTSAMRWLGLDEARSSSRIESPLRTIAGLPWAIRLLRFQEIVRCSAVLLVCLGLALAGCASATASAQTRDKSEARGYVAGELLVKFREEAMPMLETMPMTPEGEAPRSGLASVDALMERFGVQRIAPMIRKGPMSAGSVMARWYKLTLAPETDIEAAVRAFADDPSIEAAQPNHVASVLSRPPEVGP